MPIRYLPFYPDPVRGQALLDNFRRTLRYAGASDVKRGITRGMPLYETETVEHVGHPAPSCQDAKDDVAKTLRDNNLVIRGECLAACAALRDAGRTVDLVYIDPPFASGADYAKKIYLRRNPLQAARLEEAEQHLADDELAAFEEKMYGDVWEKEKYLNWMYSNLLAIKSVMSDNASIYVHLDWHIGHYVKVLLDEIFGEDNFVNEIVWKRATSGSSKARAKRFGADHDTLFLYRKNEDFIFKQVYLPYPKAEIEKRFTGVDEHGRFKDAELASYSPETLLKLKEENRLIVTKSGKYRYKIYLDEIEGVLVDSIWTDISIVNSQSKDRDLDYATQKPEALLERIIQASSNEGMTVADFFGGSGVTAAVAARLGRKFIHVDVGLNSVQTVRDRLIGLNSATRSRQDAKGASEQRHGVASSHETSFDVMEIKDGVSLYRNPVQTMDKLKTLIPGLRNEDSVDEFWEGAIQDSRLGLVPVYLPNLLDSASRILDKPMLFRILHKAIPELPPDANIRKVVVYYVQADDLPALEAFIAENRETDVEIELRDLKTVLDDVVVGDKAEWTLEEGGTGDLMNPWRLSVTRFSSDRVRQKIEEYNQKGALNPGKGGFTPLRISEEGLETLESIAADCTAAEGPFHADRDLRIDKTGRVILDGAKSGDHWDGTLSLPSKPRRLRFRNICGDESIFPVENCH